MSGEPFSLALRSAAAGALTRPIAGAATALGGGSEHPAAPKNRARPKAGGPPISFPRVARQFTALPLLRCPQLRGAGIFSLARPLSLLK
jgi:hypothetical protein